MPYSHTTLAQLKTQLSLRLGDSGKIFWVDNELQALIYEALRTYGMYSGFWRQRGTFTTVAGTAFYDIRTNLLSGGVAILGSSVTDRDIIKQVQYALLEPATNQQLWNGTEMFAYSDVAASVQNRLNQFLADTGVVVNRSLVNVNSPSAGRQQLVDTVIDVRRAAWLGASPFNYYSSLWREDERFLTAADQSWSVTENTPSEYSVMAPPPLTLQLAPIPMSSGQLELLTVDSVTLDPATSATTLGIPDDLTPAIKWGALADLLGIDGIARDPIRSSYCESRYKEYVQMARVLPVVIHAELNGVPLIASTLQEVESSTPNWENIQSVPEDIVMAAPNLIALNPVPDGVYSVTLDVVRRSDVPSADNVAVQVGREQLDMVLDYAEHLALFKVGGAEWHATKRQSENFMTQSLTYNHRISAAARASFSASMQSQRQKEGIPRRIEASGIGAMK